MNSFLQKIKPILGKIHKFLSPVTRFIKKHWEIFNPIFVLTVICLVIAAALSITNALTVNKIEAINLENKQREMSALLPADDYLEQSVSGYESDRSFSFYKATKDDTLKGYIVTTSAKGYGGDIVVMTAFMPNGEIKGVSIISADDETPGLGQNVKKESFLSRFSGLAQSATVVKNSADASKGEIDAWTGATISSRAVVTAVNEARTALAAFTAESVQMPEETTKEEITEQPEQTDTADTATQAGGGVIENQ